MKSQGISFQTKSGHPGSFEYPQHMFWLRNKKNNFELRTFIWRPVAAAALKNIISMG